MDNTTFQCILNPAIASSDEIVLYGAGRNAVKLLRTLMCSNRNPKIVGIADSDEAKCGATLCGVPIISPQGLKDFPPQTCIVITPDAHCFAIQRTLHGLGFYNLYYYNESAASAIKMSASRSGQTMRYRALREEHAEKINAARNCLNDDTSRAVFDACLRSWTHGEFCALETLVEKDQYFPEDIVSLTDKEVFVDCGVLDGATILDFTRRAGVYKHIYAFEPHPGWYETAKLHLEIWDIGQCELFNLGVYSGTGVQEFSTKNHAIQNNNHDITIHVESLDNVLREKPDRPTFIKMDIEGAEPEALSGAQELIARDHPKLAISAYHKFEHLFEIPYILKTKYPDYDIYLRQHASITETICYAL